MERVHLGLTFIQSSENKTVPVGVPTELVRPELYEWGALMAGALFGSLPVMVLYSFFVEHCVSSMTGAEATGFPPDKGVVGKACRTSQEQETGDKKQRENGLLNLTSINS